MLDHENKMNFEFSCLNANLTFAFNNEYVAFKRDKFGITVN